MNAQQALQRGERHTARRLAERAVELDPDSEEAWLTLAAVASPRASINYLEQALKINPQSPRAQKGMQWALERLRAKAATGNPRKVRFRNKFPVENPAWELLRIAPSRGRSIRLPTFKSRSPKPLAKLRWPILALFLIAICAAAVWAFWPVSAAPVLAFLHAPHSTPGIAGILADVGQPSDTPSPTATQPPTATSTPLPTSTDTPVPTDTFPYRYACSRRIRPCQPLRPLPVPTNTHCAGCQFRRRWCALDRR